MRGGLPPSVHYLRAAGWMPLIGILAYKLCDAAGAGAGQIKLPEREAYCNV